jgi:hypothetical protein
MAVGDQTDMAARIRAVLPAGWFSDTTPVLDGLLAGLGNSWAAVWQQLQAVTAQGRFSSAFDWGLDLIAADYFGLDLQRKTSEGDDAYRARISTSLLPDGATRNALIARLTALTGHAPRVFEPRRPADTGGYNIGGVGYGVAGGYGDMALPFQAFVTAYRPSGGGIAGVGGYYLGSGWAGGGYGVGALEYASPDMIAGQITDADIQQAVAAVIPEGTIAWMNITNA